MKLTREHLLRAIEQIDLALAGRLGDLQREMALDDRRHYVEHLAELDAAVAKQQSSQDTSEAK